MYSKSCERSWKSSIESSGLGIMSFFYRSYGFKFDAEVQLDDGLDDDEEEKTFSKPSNSVKNSLVNKWHFWIYLILNFVPAIGHIVSIPEQFNVTVASAALPMALLMLTGFSQIVANLALYVYVYQRRSIYCQFLRHLTMAILNIQSEAEREKVIRMTKTWSRRCASCVVILMLLSGSSYVIMAAIRVYNGPREAWLFSIRVMLMFLVTFSTVFVTSFASFFTVYLVVSCRVMTLLIPAHVRRTPSSRRKGGQTMGEHQVAHQNMSRLVEEADRVFSGFMIGALTCELIAGINCGKGYEAMADGTMLFVISVFLLYIFGQFFVKAMACSFVNEKLKSSLTLRNVPNSLQDLEHCSAEHVNYILYLNEQLINKAELTYGGFFPVRKTFIFTIAGTALTYALVLNGMG